MEKWKAKQINKKNTWTQRWKTGVNDGKLKTKSKQIRIQNNTAMKNWSKQWKKKTKIE